MEIKLNTLTPIWTGGVDGTADRLHATGLIGSLRWWYEVVVRGLGGWACDPSEHSCIYDSAKGLPSICDVCQIFGTTGWARRFRLTVTQQQKTNGISGTRQPDGQRFKRNNQSDRPNWYYKSGGFISATLDVTKLHAEFDAILILGLLKLLERQATLGAKPQMGYGIIKVEDQEQFEIDKFTEAIKLTTGNPIALNKPNLENLFFAEIELAQEDNPITPLLNLKYDLRAAFRAKPSRLNRDEQKQLRHFVCGTVKDERMASKIAISQLINGKLRVWGWIPHSLPVQGTSREEVVALIYTTIQSFGQVTKWRELASVRDTSGLIEPLEFLKSLLRESTNQ